MSQAMGVIEPTQWKERFDRFTKEHEGDEVTIEVLSTEFGDDYEAERLPLAYLEYDPKDDAFIVAVGGRDGRLQAVLRHFVEHPKSISVDTANPAVPVAVEIVDKDDSRTLVSVWPTRTTDGEGS